MSALSAASDAPGVPQKDIIFTLTHVGRAELSRMPISETEQILRLLAKDDLSIADIERTISKALAEGADNEIFHNIQTRILEYIKELERSRFIKARTYSITALGKRKALTLEKGEKQQVLFILEQGQVNARDLQRLVKVDAEEHGRRTMDPKLGTHGQLILAELVDAGLASVVKEDASPLPPASELKKSPLEVSANKSYLILLKRFSVGTLGYVLFVHVADALLRAPLIRDDVVVQPARWGPLKLAQIGVIAKVHDLMHLSMLISAVQHATGQKLDVARDASLSLTKPSKIKKSKLPSVKLSESVAFRVAFNRYGRDLSLHARCVVLLSKLCTELLFSFFDFASEASARVSHMADLLVMLLVQAIIVSQVVMLIDMPKVPALMSRNLKFKYLRHVHTALLYSAQRHLYMCAHSAELISREFKLKFIGCTGAEALVWAATETASAEFRNSIVLAVDELLKKGFGHGLRKPSATYIFIRDWSVVHHVVHASLDLMGKSVSEPLRHSLRSNDFTKLGKHIVCVIIDSLLASHSVLPAGVDLCARLASSDSPVCASDGDSESDDKETYGS